MATYRRRGRAGEVATSLSMAATSATLASPILPQTAAEDTFPLGEEEMESCLDGETQVLDHQDSFDAARNLEGGVACTTGQITVYGETEAMEDDLEGSERTAVLCDDDEHLDDVSTPCPPKRSFTEVRTESLRASGLAAARNMTPTLVDVVRNSTGCDDGDKPVDNYAEGSNLSHAARKLNFEEETSDKKMNSGNRMSQSSVSVDNSIAGLSYIYSQDPGEKLQADALEAVDKFLLVNDVGLSQDFNGGKSVDPRQSPVLSSAGAHILLKMNAPGSPVAKTRIFDWVDSLEDDGGGDFFMKSRDLLFGTTEQHSKNSNSSLKKSRPVGVSEGRRSGADSRRTRLSFSEPRSKQQTAGRHSGETDVQRREQDICDIGQDTQVAAEAIEALCRGPPSNLVYVVYTPRNHEKLSSNIEEGVRRSMRLKTLQDASVQGKSSMEKKSLKRRKDAIVEHENDHLGIKCHKVPTLGGSGDSLAANTSVLSTTPVAHRTRNSKANTGSRLGKQSADYEISEKGQTEAKAVDAKRKRSNKTAEISKETTKGRSPEEPYKPADKMDQKADTPYALSRGKLSRAAKMVPISHFDTSGEAFQSFKGNNLTEFGSSRVTRSLVNGQRHQERFKSKTSVSSGCADEKPGVRAESKYQDALDLTLALPSSKLSGAPQDYASGECKRRSSKSSVAKELIRLGRNTEAIPDTDVKDARRRRDTVSIRVCLSHHLDDDIIKQQKRILARLGISVAESVSEATHFVANKFARTRNMLEAMAAGKPVVSHRWLESCRQACCIVDEKKYILRDAKKEREMGFSMSDSLSRARQSPLLQGKRVFITPSVKPSRELVADIVKAAKGQAVERVGRCGMEDLLVISCEEDHAVCTPFLEAGRQVFGAELVLNGIIIQRLDYESHRIFVDPTKRTRFRAGSNRRFVLKGKSK